MANFRKLIGWSVAQPFIRSGARRQALHAYEADDVFLSLCAHDPTPETLRALLTFLRTNDFTFLTETDVLQREPIPGRTAWLTFDDGWKRFKDCLKVLEEFDIPATLFIAPGETQRGYLWTNALMPYRSMAYIRSLYPFSARERLARVTDILDGRLPQTLMTPDDIAALASHPLVTIGNHTLTHLSASDRPVEDLLAEVLTAQTLIADWTGTLPRTVCYPFGHRTQATDAALRSRGLTPIGLLPGRDRLTDPGLYRNMIYDDVSLAENTCRVLGAWVPIRRT